MKAVTWHGKRDVRVDEVPDPTIEEPTDAIIRITSTRHLRLGPAPLRGARPVHERGRHPRPRADGHRRGGRRRGVEHIAAGRPRRDPVQHLLRPLLHVRPAACSPSARRPRCASRAWAPRCSATRSSTAQVPGGQAEFLRVPQAQYGPIKVPEGPPDDRFVYLSDVLPTAWQAVEYADIPDGGTRRRARPRADRRRWPRASRSTAARPGDRRRPRARAARARARRTGSRSLDLERARRPRRARSARLTGGRGPDARHRRRRDGGARLAGRQARAPGRRAAARRGRARS